MTQMFRAARHYLFIMIIALLAVQAEPVLAGSGFPPASVCHALAPDGKDPVTFAENKAGWDCGPDDWQISGSHPSLVRIDMGAKVPVAGAKLITRLSNYEAVSVTAIGTDGQDSRRDITPGDVSLASSRWQMRMPLPPTSGPLAAYVIEVTGARHPGMLSDMRIALPEGEAAVSRRELVLAALCGLLSMPLVLNFAFYRALRQRFVLWHALGVFSMLVQTLVSSGLINRFASLTVTQICVMSALSWGGMILAAVRFFRDLAEPGTLDRKTRLALELVGPWTVFWTAYYLLARGDLLPTVSPFYYASFIPVIIAFGWALIFAARRGSRAAWYQIVGWFPLMAMGVVRIASLLGLTDTPMSMMFEQHLAVGFEVIVTSLGVAERFMAIRIQRDYALDQAKLHANLAEHDPLTGLLNRRAIESRFEALRAEGFDTMAAIDLDHFKSINDSHGHAVGDDVLRAVAKALTPDADTIAVRMGGEEFLLLLRGSRAAERAERRRQSVPSRVAKAQPGLARLVTASMGLITWRSPKDAAMTFAEAYEQCDKLLYRAKDEGRNCICTDEPLASFLAPVEELV